MSAAAKVLHLLAVSVWVGSVAFFSFVAAPAIFKTLPKQQAGDVVGAIFPTYYWVGHICGAVALAGLVVAARSGGWSMRAAAVGLALVVMLGANVYAGFIVQPQVAKAKAEIREATSGHTVPPPIELKERFDKLHKLSVQLNVVVLAGGIVVVALSALSLRP